MRTYKGLIKELKEKEVFVFGSNMEGFHGAGAAGYASFGVTGNQWRKFEYDKKPIGWKGMWTRKGYFEGLQEGTHGWSYALPTVSRPGQKKSLSKKQIQLNIRELYGKAYMNPGWSFYIAFSGENPDKINLNGYTTREMAEMFVRPTIPPDNIVFEENFAKLMETSYENYIKVS